MPFILNEARLDFQDKYGLGINMDRDRSRRPRRTWRKARKDKRETCILILISSNVPSNVPIFTEYHLREISLPCLTSISFHSFTCDRIYDTRNNLCEGIFLSRSALSRRYVLCYDNKLAKTNSQLLIRNIFSVPNVNRGEGARGSAGKNSAAGYLMPSCPMGMPSTLQRLTSLKRGPNNK